MLTFEDATKVVHASVGKVSKSGYITQTHSLLDLGINSDQSLKLLVSTIKFDRDVGLSSIYSELPESVPSGFSGLDSGQTIVDLVHVVQLSARKLCPNGHEQPCCPYPQTCGDCGAPIR
jgi:hypothetical protein